jgi:hypothetical protein
VGYFPIVPRYFYANIPAMVEKLKKRRISKKIPTNAKVKKMTTVSAVMLEIVEMYIFQIHLHYIFF